MKTHLVKRISLVSLSALSLALSPLAFAQSTPTNPTGSPQNSKDDANSVASQHDSAAGSSASQPGTLDRVSSKDNDNSLDKKPSQTPTGSAQESATKDPTGPTADLTSNAKPVRSSKEKDDSAPMTDQAFFAKASQDGMTEVELGKLAETQASSADVKGFGTHMVTEHGKANAELTSLAQQKGVTVQPTLDAKHQAKVDRLKHLSGPAFDKAYVADMVKAHKSAVSTFQSESTHGQDPDVKNFATKTLPTLQEHLTKVQTLQSKL